MRMPPISLDVTAELSPSGTSLPRSRLSCHATLFWVMVMAFIYRIFYMNIQMRFTQNGCKGDQSGTLWTTSIPVTLPQIHVVETWT